MTYPVKPTLFAIIIMAATASIAYTLTLLDQIVHVTLYYHGLRFDLTWASPYWTFLRIVQILLGVIFISTTVYTMFTLRTYLSTKRATEMAPSPRPRIVTSQVRSTSILSSRRPSKMSIAPSTTRPIVNSPAPTHSPSPAPTHSPSPAPTHSPSPAPVLIPSAPAGYVRCSHCRKMFTQPLRMLDFQGDRPRIINICPFCNEILPSQTRQEENEQKKSQLNEKNGDQTTKTSLRSN